MSLFKKMKVIPACKVCKACKASYYCRNEAFEENWIVIIALYCWQSHPWSRWTLHAEDQKLRRVIISAQLPLLSSHNKWCFIFMLHKDSKKRHISKIQNLLLHRQPFHTSKAFISAFIILFALLYFVLKSYKTKIWFFITHGMWCLWLLNFL